MQEKVVLVTGASRGLGKELATAFLKKGFFVYAGVRDINLAPANTTPIWLDLTNEQSLLLCVDKIIKEKGRIDIVVNNAAMAYFGPVDSMTMDETKELFEVNLFGTVRLTQLFLPYFRDQMDGKIIFISSVRGTESHAYMGMYSASKAALEAIAFDWAVTLAKWNIQVSVIQPGPLATNIQMKHGSYFKNEENPYLPYCENYKLEWQTPEDASKVIVESALLSHLPFRIQTNEFAKNIISKHLKDASGSEWFIEQKKHFI